MWVLMRFDEINTSEDCDTYLEQMYVLYSMPKNTDHWDEYWSTIIRTVAEKRAEITGLKPYHMRLSPAVTPMERHRRMRQNPEWRPDWVD